MDWAAVFDRPVIILAAPRSGSTLLFESLSKAAGLWTIGGESHVLIESIAALNPVSGAVDSNRLTASQASPRIIAALRQNFARQLRDRDGQRLLRSGAQPVRMLEKTPKNALRQPFLEQVFPGARYIWLVRDPRQNIASMMDAWQAGRWVTYRKLPGWQGKWSLLLPPGWREQLDQPLESICAWQWRAANATIRSDLADLDRNRWLKMDYQSLIDDPLGCCRKLSEFMDIPLDQRWLDYLKQPLPHSRYTLSAPGAEKWRRHEAAILSVEDQWRPLWGEIG